MNDEQTPKYKATPEYRFFLYDPENAGMLFYGSAADRDRAAELTIAEYSDPSDGWFEEGVMAMCAGVITGTPAKSAVQKRPADSEIDDEGCDGEGTYWGDFDCRCNYVMQPVELDGNGLDGMSCLAVPELLDVAKAVIALAGTVPVPVDLLAKARRAVAVSVGDAL